MDGLAVGQSADDMPSRDTQCSVSPDWSTSLIKAIMLADVHQDVSIQDDSSAV